MQLYGGKIDKNYAYLSYTMWLFNICTHYGMIITLNWSVHSPACRVYMCMANTLQINSLCKLQISMLSTVFTILWFRSPEFIHPETWSLYHLINILFPLTGFCNHSILQAMWVYLLQISHISRPYSICMRVCVGGASFSYCNIVSSCIVSYMEEFPS